MEPLRLAATLLDQPPSVADELAQLALTAVGDVAAAEEAVAEEVGDPLGVLHIGLAPGDGLDVAGVDDEQPEVGPLEQVVDRLPIDARALHRDLGHAQTEQPVGQREQLVGDRAERPQLPTGGGDDAGHDRVAVDVEPGAAFVDDVQDAPPL